VGWLTAMMESREMRQQLRAANRARNQQRGTPAWRMMSRLVAKAHRTARDAWRGKILFPNSERALRRWNRIWLGISECASGIAARLIARLPQGSEEWQAMTQVHHVATQDVAHLRGHLPEHRRLPHGAYAMPPGYRAPARLVAAAAAEYGTARALADMGFLAQAGVVRRPKAPKPPRGTGRHAAPRPVPGSGAPGAA
jgi:hypothetical protein